MRMRHARRRSDRGVTLFLVALTMIALLTMSAFALDLGSSWVSKRKLTTSTDAAVLAAARTTGFGGDGCLTQAAAILIRNTSTAAMDTCTTSPLANGATMIRITSRVEVPYRFAQVIGYESGTVRVTSTARVGRPKSAIGVRPLGICVVATAALSTWLSAPTSSTSLKIPYTKQNPASCNSGSNVPGNWGTVDLDGGSNSNADTKDWIQNGFDLPVNSGSPGGTCVTDPSACYYGDTGAISGSVSSELQSLVDSAIKFPIPLFDQASGTGANARLHIVGFALVQLTAFDVSGSASQRYLTFTFQPGVVVGTCCGSNSIDTGARVVQMCDPTVINGGCNAT